MAICKEKVSYLKGLAEGMKLSDTTNEGKMLLAMLDVLEELAATADYVEEGYEELSEQVDAIDEDLAALEDDFYGECEDEDGCGCGDDCDCDDDCDCGDNCKCNDEEEFTMEVVCPKCKETIEVTEDEMDDEDGSFECPKCNERIEFDVDCDCGCGHNK